MPLLSGLKEGSYFILSPLFDACSTARKWDSEELRLEESVEDGQVPERLSSKKRYRSSAVPKANVMQQDG